MWPLFHLYMLSEVSLIPYFGETFLGFAGDLLYIYGFVYWLQVNDALSVNAFLAAHNSIFYYCSTASRQSWRILSMGGRTTSTSSSCRRP